MMSYPFKQNIDTIQNVIVPVKKSKVIKVLHVIKTCHFLNA